MVTLLSVLMTLCGIDYNGKDYNKCVTQSKKCLDSHKKITNLLDPKQKKIFYKCYSRGAGIDDK